MGGIKVKGSITIMVSICTVLFLAFICGGLESARSQGARAKAAAVLDMGLFSVFGEYERLPLEEYDIFTLACGGKTGTFNVENLKYKLEDYMSYNIFPGKDLSLGGNDLLKVRLQKSTIQEYELLTDRNGQAFVRQAAAYVKENAGLKAIEKLQSYTKQGEEMEEKGKTYEESSKEIEERQEVLEKEQAKAEQEKQEEETEVETETPAPPIENPLEIIKKVKEMGVLGLVLREPDKVSQKQIDKKQVPSGRTCQSGTMNGKKEETSLTENLLFRQYLLEHFGYYGKPKQNSALTYEMEYLLGGMETDAQNLKKVVHKLLLAREGSNFLYAMANEEMRNQALALATVLVGAAAIPGLITITKTALLLAWAYGESLLDVRCLLAGGKIPLVKDANSWKLSLSNLTRIMEVLQEADKGGGEGKDYGAYLQMLLLAEKAEKLPMRALDLIEARCRMEVPEFRADYGVVAMKVVTMFRIPPVFFPVAKAFLNVKQETIEFQVKGSFCYG